MIILKKPILAHHKIIRNPFNRKLFTVIQIENRLIALRQILPREIPCMALNHSANIGRCRINTSISLLGSRTDGEQGLFWNNLCYFSVELYAVGTHQNHLSKVILMSTHNMRLCWETWGKKSLIISVSSGYLAPRIISEILTTIYLRATESLNMSEEYWGK